MTKTRTALAMAVVALFVLQTSAVGAAPAVTLAERFEDPTWNVGWADWRTSDEANTALVDGYKGDGLRVRIPPNQRRGSGALYRLPADTEEVWFRYHLRLDSFEPITSGKLPGPSGTPFHTGKGCFRSVPAYPGWSARLAFQPAGRGVADTDEVPIGYYVYHLDQPGTCGEYMGWGPRGILSPDRWYCIEGHVRLNTPGANDGLLEGWVDGEEAFSRAAMAFRRPGEEWLGVRSFWLNVFFGGATIPNDRNLDLRIDELQVGTAGRLGCAAYCAGVPATLVGSADGVPLVGTGDRDILLGTRGDDVIMGRQGDDVICGRGGNDRIIGGGGDDVVSGGTGRDLLRGGAGSDTVVYTGRADNVVDLGRGYASGSGRDQLSGIEGVDAGDGDDLVIGGPGDNVLSGNAGNDVVRGGVGNDVVIGREGDDLLRGGPGDDVLDGGTDEDQDRCHGGLGNNTTWGCEPPQPHVPVPIPRPDRLLEFP